MRTIQLGLTQIAGASSSVVETCRSASNVLKIFFIGLARDRIVLLLLGIFTIIYFPHVFILVEDIGLISAYEVDAGSHLIAIESLLKTYNMHSAYHSKFYGWTFFALNYALITPIRYSLMTIGYDGVVPIYLSVRVILFCVGLFSTTIYYGLLKEFFLGRFFPVLGAILYIFSPVGFRYFYFIHPETLGISFIFLATLFLVKFSDSPNSQRLYYPALVCLVLAALCKQIFFFLSLPVLACFFHVYCRLQNISYISFVLSRTFMTVAITSAVIAVLLLVIIHPFSVLDFNMFLHYQNELRGFFSGDNTLSLKQALAIWVNILRGLPLFVIWVWLLPAILFISLICFFRSKDNSYFLSIVNSISIIAIGSMIVLSNRLFPSRYYFQPIYPFLIISLLSAAWFMTRIRDGAVKGIVTVIFLYIYVCIFISGVYEIYPQLLRRLNYQNSMAYLSYDYVNKNVQRGTRIAHDHFVGIPDAFSVSSCHYWRGCGTDNIEAFDPTYVIFNQDYNINGIKYAPTERLKKYVSDHSMVLVKTLVDDQSPGSPPIVVSIYKK